MIISIFITLSTTSITIFLTTVPQSFPIVSLLILFSLSPPVTSCILLTLSPCLGWNYFQKWLRFIQRSIYLNWISCHKYECILMGSFHWICEFDDWENLRRLIRTIPMEPWIKSHPNSMLVSRISLNTQNNSHLHLVALSSHRCKLVSLRKLQHRQFNIIGSLKMTVGFVNRSQQMAFINSTSNQGCCASCWGIVSCIVCASTGNVFFSKMALHRQPIWATRKWFHEHSVYFEVI